MMKNLQKLKLHNPERICVKEQRSIKGGEGDAITPGMIGEVDVFGEAPENYFYGYYGNGGESVFDGENGFSSGYNGFVSSSGEGADQIWSVFRGWAGSDIPYTEENTASTEEEISEGGGGASIIRNNCSISDHGKNFIKSWEKGPNGGAALTPYDDNGTLPGGFMTIGWGHKILPGENFSAGITLEKADSLFLADLQNSINDVNNSIKVSLTQEQFDALVSYSFNIGGLRKSPSCLTKLNNGDYSGAAEEMDIVTSGGLTYPGLVTRRADERTLFTYGTYNLHN